MAGFGRTGKWFACDHWDVVPDILCVAKGINSGYVPLGAMIARGEIVDQVRDYFAEALGGLQAKHPSIGEVRGLGCFYGIELVKNRDTREMLVPFNASGEAAAPVGRIGKAA